jgi:putative pyoverdin transport system ATP-binding/permease protein
MSFLQLIRREAHGSLLKLMCMSGVGGLSNAAMLAAINAATEAVARTERPSLRVVVIFLVSLFLFIKSQLYITITTSAEIEAIIHRIRLRLMDQIRRSELPSIENIGRSNIVAAITSDTAVLTQTSSMLSAALQALVIVFFVGLYVAYMSLAAFVLTAVITGVGVTLFHIENRRLIPQAQEAAQRERVLFDRLTDFLNGFKEVRLNRLRSADLFNDAVDVSRTAANLKIRTQAETHKKIVLARISLFIVIGAVVFLAPNFTDSLSGSSLTKTTMALLFVIGACFYLAETIPVLPSANAAADRINRLEVALRATTTSTESDGIQGSKRFNRIEMHDIVFRYLDKLSGVTFKIGPLDFILRSRDLVFITGGNGSGKSTFLKVLAGLYPPDSGQLTLDGVHINDDTREEYRALMSAVFTDYHLFRRLYGIPDSEQAEVTPLLMQFHIADKTSLSEGEFRTLDLSGGQRKRLALIVSLLEKRQILLLDEWASDQDPEFRRKFYHELLPELTQAGITVVVITHDERYLDELHFPARRLRMDEGRFVEL